MLNVGVIGIGMMGNAHLDVYSQLPDVKIFATADRIPERRSGNERTAMNIQSVDSRPLDFSGIKQYAEGLELLQDPNIQLVDICVPTPGHIDLAIAALKAGKHVLVEKPIALSYAEAQRLVAAARETSKFIMCAQCMRYWPEWRWIKETIDAGTFGPVLAAQFRRTSGFPGKWYANANESGGAILDLHIHDTDYIQYLFGMPKAVRSNGYARDSKGIDHVVTQYLYDNVPLVVAEGAWSMANNYGFNMQFCINFAEATAIYDLGQTPNLKVLTRKNGEFKPSIPTGTGYFHEIRYLTSCIINNTKPNISPVDQAANSVKIVEAERQSIATGQTITL